MLCLYCHDMTWTAPAVTRVDPPPVANERATLVGYLDFHRATFLLKCAGLTGDQLARQAIPPSTLSLLGLIRHLVDVERAWFRIRLSGEDVGQRYWTEQNPDADFDDLDPDAAEQDHEALVAEMDHSRQRLAGRSLDDTFVHPRTGETLSVRWLLAHLIEEYARHNGHADLLREVIDGAVGE